MKLNDESVFIYPTDTVWGIGASIRSKAAREKINLIKRSPDDKPLSIMFTDISTLYNSFNFPDGITVSWLRNFFKLESTLGVPLKISKISIPPWVTAKSELVSVRCLEFPALKEIGQELGAPFFTTSLNLAGEPPITNYEDAVDFQKAHASDCEIFGDSTHDLSGRSSTIVFLRANTFEIIRVGLKVEEIKKHLLTSGLGIS